jgi:hypothetical protein
MRRALSIVFILFLGLGPLAATLQGDDARLPICCRRNGAHHCVMAAESLARIIQTASGKTPAIGAPSHCPQYPGTALATISPVHALAPAAVTSFALSGHEHWHLAFQPTAFGIATCTHAVRGPPAAVHG